jgi:transposase-like protein
MDTTRGWNRPEAEIGRHPGRCGKTRRKLVDGVVCPRCRSEAIYRYGKTASGRRRYLCQVCRRQFSLKPPGRLAAEERPACPVCAKPMHIYMREGGCMRFR